LHRCILQRTRNAVPDAGSNFATSADRSAKCKSYDGTFCSAIGEPNENAYKPADRSAKCKSYDGTDSGTIGEAIGNAYKAADYTLSLPSSY